MEFQPKEETKTQHLPLLFQYKISEKGEVDFRSEGLREWELTDALSQVEKQASQAQSAKRKLLMMTASSELALHAIAFSFALFFCLTISFTLTYIVRSATQPGGGNVPQQTAD
jgi:hypothetical protein